MLTVDLHQKVVFSVAVKGSYKRTAGVGGERFEGEIRGSFSAWAGGEACACLETSVMGSDQAPARQRAGQDVHVGRDARQLE